ncbi:MAG TPA: hypothetical protein PK801_10150 [Aggregatilineales bacterium]|nr:hypothetical protein [Chloroflexota bacterium]HOA24361.1 hypothetical protein [Aggregatilineales bacterium]HPV07248.1 hypothetical protein [Aggregatilineales bacterium]HQA68675.1 hypothetical protein [Aggregatilineales bacterium]HQE18500.1 hypothetical protein [Aggregatilineales bacterium]
MEKASGHPPFWGLKIEVEPGAHVLVLEDRLDERRPVLERLLGSCHVTWAEDVEAARRALVEHGPFDIYCLDYDLGDEDGGWYAAGELIREHDPWSVAKIVLIHSANAQARAYYSLFPAAVFIQWDVLATMLGSPLIDADLVNAVLAEVRPGAREEELVETALRIRGSETGDK